MVSLLPHGDQLVGVALVLVVPLVAQPDHAAVLRHVQDGDVVAVDVAVDPVEELFRLLAQLQPVEAGTVGEVEVVLVIAGHGVVQVKVQLHAVLELARLVVQEAEHHLLAVDGHADAAVGHVDQIVDPALGLDGIGVGAVGGDSAQTLVVGHHHVALAVQLHVVAAQPGVRGHLHRRAAELVALLVKPADVILLDVLLVLPVFLAVLLGVALDPGGGHVLDGHKAIRRKADAVEVGVGDKVPETLVVLFGRQGAVALQLRHLAVFVHEVQEAGVDVELTLVGGGLALVGPLAHFLVLGEVDAVLVVLAHAHPVLGFLQQRRKRGGVHELRRRGGGGLLGSAVGGRRGGVLALAAGRHAQRQHQRKQEAAESRQVLFHVQILRL